MMDGQTNHWWRQDRDRFLVQEGIMSNEFKLIIHKAITMSEPPVWSFPVSLHRFTISSHTLNKIILSLKSKLKKENKYIYKYMHMHTQVINLQKK